MLLGEAAEIFGARDAVVDLRQVDAVRQRLHGPTLGTGPRPAFGWESLTPTELKVVDLVAEGRTTPQIAQQLFVSPNTIVTHLRHVFAKLGMHSRTEVAAEAVRRRPRA